VLNLPGLTPYFSVDISAYFVYNVLKLYYVVREIDVEITGQSLYKQNIFGTEVDVEVVPSAMKHGKTVADILKTLDHIIFDETITADPNKTLAVGFDVNANLCEVIFHVVSDEHIVVFHAMPCRKKYLEQALKRR
jgi:hypothetical protein